MNDLPLGAQLLMIMCCLFSFFQEWFGSYIHWLSSAKLWSAAHWAVPGLSHTDRRPTQRIWSGDQYRAVSDCSCFAPNVWLFLFLFLSVLLFFPPHASASLAVSSIEHLSLAHVEKFSEVVFGYMTPLAVIVSTPNSDFNPLLPGLAGFRHSDHKFEWTRAEFRSWYSTSF